MNASEKLQAVIKARLEGEVFGWGPILLVWAGLTALRMIADVLWGPTWWGGAGFAAGVLLFQFLWPRRPAASSSARGWALQGLWLMLAVTTWFLGSVAPVQGLLSPLACGVLELVFLAGGLAQTGIMKARNVLTLGGGVLVIAAVLIAVFPPLLAVRSIAVLLCFGLPAFLVHRSDKKA